MDEYDFMNVAVGDFEGDDMVSEVTIKAVAGTVLGVLTGSRRATKYIASDLVVKACARFPPRKRARITDIVLTIGKPNYRERAFIAKCKKAGEPFPVKRIQHDAWPSKNGHR